VLTYLAALALRATRTPANLVALERSFSILKLLMNKFRAVIFLDWSGVDLSSNPLHPASKLFDSRSSMELQCIYILNIERLGVSVVLQKEG